MSSNLVYPHVYKKGKLLNLKQLDEGTHKKDKKYFFSSNIGSLTSVINSCNNINQIVGRNWLHLSKLLSYFGLSKDLSEKLSKKGTPSNFNKFASDFKRGGITLKNLQKLKKLLQDQSLKIKEIEEKLQPKSIGEEEVLRKLDDIHSGLKQVLGV